MRSLLLVLVFTNMFCGNSLSQHRIGVIDFEFIAKEVTQAIGLDSLEAISNDTIEKLRNSWKTTFSKKLSDIQNHFCGSAEEYKRITSKLEAEMDDISRLEAIAKDSLLQWRREYLASIDLIVHEKTSVYAKKKKLRLVVDKKQVLYFKSRMDFTKAIAEIVLLDTSELMTFSKAYHDKVLAELGGCMRPDEYWKGW